MTLHGVIPAAQVPGREGLELGAVRLDGLDAERWLLTTANSGSALLELGKETGRFFFSHGEAHHRSSADGSARAFVDAVAEWLGLELAEAEEEVAPATEGPRAEAECSWVRLGEGSDGLGTHWTGFKLFLRLGERYAEVFFRVSADGARAQLVEKWSAYRQELIEILERALADAPPRRVRERTLSEARRDGARAFGVRGAFTLELPVGWLLREEPGHYRLSDPDDEMMIEFSYLRLPPLPPEAPGVLARMQAIVDASDHRDTALPIATFERSGVTYAWSEYRFDSRDTKRPEVAPRPARGRWFIAANDWIQVLVTGCWWETDVVAGERAWNDVIASLELASRISPPLETRGDA